MIDCPFCSLSPSRIVHENDHCVAIKDAFPVSQGHTLIISKRHVRSFFELSEVESLEVFRLLDVAKHKLDDEHRPNGFNVGINDGKAAGQTIGHLHVHLIPRYLGDRSDPRGGVRWIFPDKADYWSER